jgi:hypothetical protein
MNLRKPEPSSNPRHTTLRRQETLPGNCACKVEAECCTKLRQIPLSVLERGLGATRPSRQKKKNWRTEAGRMTVDDLSFLPRRGQGGGGAMDLAGCCCMRPTTKVPSSGC